MVIILSSPSGGGKTSIAKQILKDSKIKLSISATTRKPRRNEQDTVDYFFKTKEEFQELINKKAFLEYATVYDNLYGTPKDYVYNMLSEGFDVLFDIDYQGAKQIRKKLNKKVLSIFIMPPSVGVLKTRLKRRGHDNSEDLENRLQLAKKEIQYANDYEYTVVNNSLTQAVNEVREIIKKERINRFK